MCEGGGEDKDGYDGQVWAEKAGGVSFIVLSSQEIGSSILMKASTDWDRCIVIVL